MHTTWSVRRPPESGATAVEYGVLVALVAAVVVAVVIMMGRQVCGSFSEASDEFRSAGMTATAAGDPSCP